MKKSVERYWLLYTLLWGAAAGVVMMSGLDAGAAHAVNEAPGRTVFMQKPFVLNALVSELLRLRN